MAVRLEWFFATALPLAAGAMVLAHIEGPAGGGLMSLTSFCLCFLLSLYQVVESVDAQWAPVGVSMVATMLFGPILAFMVFGGIWLHWRRPDVGTVAGLLCAHLLGVLAVSYAAVPSVAVALDRAGWTIESRSTNLTYMAGVLGWAIANFWRPLNEA